MTAPIDYALPVRRRSSRRPSRLLLLILGTLALLFVSLGIYVAIGIKAYVCYVQSRESLRALSASLQRYADTHQGQYPASLADLPASDPAAQWALSASRFRYLGAGQSPGNPDVIVAHDHPFRDSGENVMFADGAISWLDFPSLTRALAISRTLTTLTTAPTNQPKPSPPNDTLTGETSSPPSNAN